MQSDDSPQTKELAYPDQPSRKSKIRHLIARSIPEFPPKESQPTPTGSPAKKTGQLRKQIATCFSSDEEPQEPTRAQFANNLSPVFSPVTHLSKEEEFALVTWLRNIAKKYKNKTYAQSSLRDYRRKAAKLNRARPSPDIPPDIAQLSGTKRSYYAYRAALIWDSVNRAQAALRQRDRADSGSAEHGEAIHALMLAKRDLETYPPDPFQERRTDVGFQNQLAELGLARRDSGEWQKAVEAGKTRKPERKGGKARTVNRLNRDIPDWRNRIWDRLIQIGSDWLEFAATCALTGCRPEE